jgi:predicted dehydrogenase
MRREMREPIVKQNSFTRRQFLRQSAGLTFSLAAAPSFIPASALGRDGAVAPSNRITVASIGVGQRGPHDLRSFLEQKEAQVVAVCDVHAGHLEKGRQIVNQKYGNSDCAAYGDFREVMARKDIDACVIATADQWHVLTALAAVRSGKDVYVEKPLAISLTEDWTLRREVHRHKRIFQFGTQQRSDRLFRFACELVRNGRIGKLKHITVWSPGGAPGGSTEVVPPPPGLNYDFWQGQARAKPYTQDLCGESDSQTTWIYVSDYALGFVAGWGIHPMDIAVWGAPEHLFGGPLEVEGRGTFHSEGVCDTATIWNVNMKTASGVTLQFVGVPNGHNQGLPTGEPWPEEQEWKQRYRRISTHGTAFEGTDGWVHVDRDGINLQPENLVDQNEDSFKVRLPRSSHHVRNFLECIKSRAPTVAPIDEAVRSDTLCHLSDIAMRLNRKVVWDPKEERFIDDAEASLRLARKMRPPWHL